MSVYLCVFVFILFLLLLLLAIIWDLICAPLTLRIQLAYLTSLLNNVHVIFFLCMSIYSLTLSQNAFPPLWATFARWIHWIQWKLFCFSLHNIILHCNSFISFLSLFLSSTESTETICIRKHNELIAWN